MIGLGEVSADGEVSKSIERGLASQAARDLSNEWMGDVLGGRTTLDFDKWKEERGDGNDVDPDPDDGPAADTGGGQLA